MIYNAYGEDDYSEVEEPILSCDHPNCDNEAVHFLKGGEKLCGRHFRDLEEDNESINSED